MLGLERTAGDFRDLARWPELSHPRWPSAVDLSDHFICRSRSAASLAGKIELVGTLEVHQKSAAMLQLGSEKHPCLADILLPSQQANGTSYLHYLGSDSSHCD
jgi:hypothetical protein